MKFKMTTPIILSTSILFRGFVDNTQITTKVDLI